MAKGKQFGTPPVYRDGGSAANGFPLWCQGRNKAEGASTLSAAR